MTMMMGAMIVTPETLAKIAKDSKTQRQFTDSDTVILVGILAKKSAGSHFIALLWCLLSLKDKCPLNDRQLVLFMIY
jgi:hypothetical protein